MGKKRSVSGGRRARRVGIGERQTMGEGSVPMWKKYYLAGLGLLLLIEFAVLAIHPSDRSDWLLENTLLVVFVIALVLSYRRLPLSALSYTLIFVFLFLHEIGAHYTYAKVPYEAFFQDTLGVSVNGLMGWQRNQFDRLLHFGYGLLFAWPLRESLCRMAGLSGGWGHFFALALVMATSMLYELIEWLAAELFGDGLGMAFLGTQGDVWDAHKDMALATVGALIAIALALLPSLWPRAAHPPTAHSLPQEK
tara:strand:- start:81443 stop:82195 length:753 start_codon:yes stop_codon:yes gene_type:complete